MDKKNVHFQKARIFYGKSIDCDDKKILWCGHKKNNFQIVTINFLVNFGWGFSC
jgi:hypothetical protein